MKSCRMNNIMCACLLVCLIILFGQGFSLAEETVVQELDKKVYVKPSSEVAVRTGKGTDFKIVALVKDGTAITLLEEDEFYARVRLPNQKEGWMLTRFLSEEPPLRELVSILQQEKDTIVSREAETKDKLGELSTTLKETTSQLKQVIKERDSTVKDYNSLQQATADVVTLKTEMEETQKNNEQLSEKLSALKLENDNFNKDKKLHWFLAGAGVLLLGILLGKMPSPSRKRKSSLM